MRPPDSADRRPDTHDAQSTSKTRGPQALGIAGGIDTGHIQCLHHAQMLFPCGGSDDDDPNACRSQQLHHPDAEPLHTAHDHVADPGPGVRRPIAIRTLPITGRDVRVEAGR